MKSRFDDTYMRMAEVWASNSHSERLKVGCLVVKNGMIISDGYNGTPKGFDNVCENAEGHTLAHVLHAEANAITKLAKSTQTSVGAHMYTTVSPCVECAKLIIQSEISRVIYRDLYRDEAGIELLKAAKIQVEKI